MRRRRFFAVLLAAVLALLLHFSLVISSLADQSKVLAQRVAAQSARIDQLEAALAERERAGEPQHR